MRHQRKVFAGRLHLTDESQEVVGILALGKSVRPVSQRLGADAYAVQVRQVGPQQRLDVAAQHRGFHHHRVAAGEQHAAHLRVVPHVVHQLIRLPAGKLQIGVTDELCPAKTVAAVGVASLPLTWKKQNRLLIFVLHAANHLAAKRRHVELHLPGGMRIELPPDFIRRQLDLRLGGTLGHQVAHALKIDLLEHAALREG